jgi:hypothetical protein
MCERGIGGLKIRGKTSIGKTRKKIHCTCTVFHIRYSRNLSTDRKNISNTLSVSLLGGITRIR